MDINLLDPLGFVKAVRNQANQVATRMNMPAIPEPPAVNLVGGRISVFNPMRTLRNRPGYSRTERAG
jgi:hypothetical protein